MSADDVAWGRSEINLGERDVAVAREAVVITVLVQEAEDGVAEGLGSAMKPGRLRE